LLIAAPVTPSSAVSRTLPVGNRRSSTVTVWPAATVIGSAVSAVVLPKAYWSRLLAQSWKCTL
jgi:hypothetical protein